MNNIRYLTLLVRKGLTLSHHHSLGKRPAAERTPERPLWTFGGHLGGAEAEAGGSHHQRTGWKAQTCSVAHPSAQRSPGGGRHAGGVRHTVHGGATHACVYTGGKKLKFHKKIPCVSRLDQIWLYSVSHSTPPNFANVRCVSKHSHLRIYTYLKHKVNILKSNFCVFTKKYFCCKSK